MSNAIFLTGATVNIMWKEIAIILIAMFLLVNLPRVLIAKKHNAIMQQFLANDLSGLQAKAESLKKQCSRMPNISSKSSFNTIYNNLCCVLAYFSLENGDTSGFLNELYSIRNEQNYPMKAFLLSLYFRSVPNDEKAIEWHNAYLRCENKDSDLTAVLDYLKDRENSVIPEAVGKFRNPAVIRLLKDNNVIYKS